MQKLAGRNISSGLEDGSMSNKTYFKGWPYNCPYIEDLKWACQVSIKYLQSILPKLQSSGKKGLVIFDIDDTLLFGDPAHAIPVKEMEIGESIFILPPNMHIVNLAKQAKQMGFSIVALTARPKESRESSVLNLNMFQIPYDMIIMNDKDQYPEFKIDIRKKLEQKNQIVVLTIGDQIGDLYMPGNAAAIKLPEPDLKCSYAYFPGKLT